MRRSLFLAAALAGFAAAAAHASTVCPRGTAGGIVTPPADLASANGVLSTTLAYHERAGAQGQVLRCFETTDGTESPTLHVLPGDHVRILLHNAQPLSMGAGASMPVTSACADDAMNAGSVNIHFHGMNITPACHGDEVLHTAVNPGKYFQYSFDIPANEPPGLYWYHPHIHGISAAAVFGGASGALIVDGIETVQPVVAGLPQRVLVIRDQPVPGVVLHGEPNANLSVNYVPVNYPGYTPAVLQVQPGAKEFWRVVNASADTILDLQLVYGGQPQKLGIVALDGVATYSQNGNVRGGVVAAKDILIPPAGRAEFVVTMPAASVAKAQLMTKAIDTGPTGDADPARPLATLTAAPAGAGTAVPAGAGTAVPAGAGAAPVAAAARVLPAAPDRFAGLDTARVIALRKLYFSEAANGPGDGQTNFYLTVDGQTPTLFNPANPPAITTTQGAVEDWIIENRSTENHEFHIHQVHFKLLRRNLALVPLSEQQMLDTVQIPYWSGSGPYPSVTVRMDFRGPVVGDFVYHCHILDHEDGGMMATIRVLPRGGSAASTILGAAPGAFPICRVRDGG